MIARLRPWRNGETLVVGLGCLALALALYGPALRGYLVGDDISFVRANPNWLREAFRPIGPWHYYPVTAMMFSLLGAMAGQRPGPLHLVSILMHAGIGLALYAWLARFALDRWVRMLAAAVFLSRGISYETVIWITEQSYLLVTLLTLGTLAAWDAFLRGRGGRWLVLATAAFAVALFTMEHALLIPGIVVLYDWIVRPARDGEGTTPLRARLAPRSLARDALHYAPFVLVTLAFLAIKHGQHVALLQATATPGGAPAAVPSGYEVTGRLSADRTWLGSFNTPLRAWRDLLLGTSFSFLPAGTLFGIEDTWLTRHPWLALLPWLAIHLWIVGKGRPLARFLLCWTYLYLVPLAIASVPQARYYYMATVPASALLALGVAAAGRALAPRVLRVALGVAAGLALAALVLGEGAFLRARLAEWQLASDIVRGAVEAVQRDVSPATRVLYAVNMPRTVPGPWVAYAFSNTTEYLPILIRPPRADIQVRTVYDRTFVDGRWPTLGRYASASQVREALRAPDTLGYQFLAPPPRVERMR